MYSTVSVNTWNRGGVFRLSPFVLLSLCVHGGLLLAIAAAITAPGPIGPMPTVLSVRLSVEKTGGEKPVTSPAPASATTHRQPSPPTHRQRPARHVVNKSVAPRIVRTPSPPPQPRPVSTASLAPMSPVAENFPDTAQAPRIEPALSSTTGSSTAASAAAMEANQAAVRKEVRTLLLKDLARRFNYPLIARRRGWQGRVLLSITVRSNGTLARVHVTQSSGFDILDRSAVNTLRSVGQLADASPSLRGQSLELLLPVVYRLTD